MKIDTRSTLKSSRVTLGPASGPTRAIYVVLRPLPARLHYRDATVLLECARDCSMAIPAWVFRARKLVTTGRPAMAAFHEARHARPLPTISPIALAAARQTAKDAVVIASSAYGRRDLDRKLRTGIVLELDTAASRLMDALAALGYVARQPATSR